MMDLMGDFLELYHLNNILPDGTLNIYVDQFIDDTPDRNLNNPLMPKRPV